MKIPIKFMLLVIATTFAVSTTSFAAPPLVEVFTSSDALYSPGTFGTTSASSGFVSRSKAVGVNGDGYSGSGRSFCSAGFGVLRTFGTCQMSTSQSGNIHYVWASAKFRDSRITDAPGRTGQQGFVTVRYTVTGSVSLAAPPAPAGSGISQSYADAYTSIRLNGTLIAERNQKQSADGNPTCGSIPCTNYLGVQQTVTYPVTFGTPYDFEVFITSRPTLRSYPGFSGLATVDLGHTMTWGGIASVTDAGGNPITNFTDISASGTNYVTPILPVCAAPPAALTGWWPGDNNTRDIKGANNGVLENGATYGSGRVASAFSFPGSGARVRVPHAAALDYNATQDYSVEFWMKAGPQAAPAVLVAKNGATIPYSVRLLANGTISASAFDGTNTVSVTSTASGTGAAGAGIVNDNVWHHIAAVFKHSTKTLQLYVDGGLNASSTYAPTLGTLANGQPLYFGALGNSGSSFIGSLDEIDIHSAALSLAEVQAIAAAGDLGKCRPAVIPTSVVSRKTHGGAGDFDINLPLSGTTGVESRSGGATSDYQIVVTFAAPIAVTGTPQAEVVGGTATVGSNGVANGGAVTISGNTVTIPLTGVTNAQTLSVRLNAADNGANTADVLVPLSVLVGDTNGDRVVNGGDAIQTRARAGQGASETNFRSDVNTDGTINSGDAIAVRSRSGTALP
jgi:hypothetical protein